MSLNTVIIANTTTVALLLAATYALAVGVSRRLSRLLCWALGIAIFFTGGFSADYVYDTGRLSRGAADNVIHALIGFYIGAVLTLGMLHYRGGYDYYDDSDDYDF